MKIILDTNIIIDHLRNIPQATKQLQEVEDGNYTGLISVITVDSNIAKAAGNLLAKYRASHGLEPMDALIAATAQVNKAVLFTLNKKRFRFIEGLVVINPYLAV
ncbi:type II toxin-antitoxin system VapC family toxin [Desulfofalx alkaliphila]|uniref:type II toxin-antitoxin system VapC family toxin n=1 Tax=Desulfofalx alkaliphila TaxID=105483 RepID=UPI0004E219C7|nr:type II toxin-antitoxin system VapC family toxin [Desulfofalx alkaliphila]